MINMEIRLFRSLSLWSERKHFLCAKVECPVTFNFSASKEVFKSIYGSNVVFEVVCL